MPITTIDLRAIAARRDASPEPSTIEGFIDSFDGTRIVGWAYDRADPTRRLLIEIATGESLTTVVADRERSDVAATGKNDGLCGFVAEPLLDLAAREPIHVREASTGVALSGSPITAVHPPVPAAADDGPDIEGFVDFIDGNRIVGWARDRSLPRRRLRIEITVGGHATLVTADRYRQDVAADGDSDGRCGFELRFDVQSAGRSLIRVREASTGAELGGSPVRADILNRIAGPADRLTLDLLRAEARLALDGLETSRLPAGDASIAASGTGLGRLLATASAGRDPEGLISRYAAFEIDRSERRDLVPDGSLVDRMRILHWYLTRCGAYHGMPVPLSAQQIAFLNAPMPLLGLDAEISVAAHAFITTEYDPSIDLHDPTARAQAVYWWCVERSHRIAPGGELITPAQVRLLTAPDASSAQTFPLTIFLREFHARDPALGRLNLRSDAGRAALTMIVMLRALGRPHLIRLLPPDLAVALLGRTEIDAGADRAPLFDDLLRLASGSWPGCDRPRVDEIGRAVRALFGGGGDTAAPTGSGLPFLRDPRIADGSEPGVAVIGPVRATSGLGQAARLSLDILARAGREPVCLDFFPGDAGPVGLADRAVVDLSTPRRINLMHLNAEVVPHAFALLDRRVIGNAYNIGYFFWELDTVPDSHRLALDLLDEIWVASEFNRETYARATSVPVHNVGMAAAEIPEVAPLDRASLGLPADAFIFLFTFDAFSYVERKNPLGLLAAFQAAFPVGSSERAALVLKTQNRRRVVDPHQLAVWRRVEDIAARDARIHIVDRTLGYSTMIALTRACDAYVSLHRSEGWGFGLLEAMRLGLPVIATGYSGNLEFCTPETAFLVDYDLIAVLPSDYIYAGRGSRWADPSISSAANALRTVFEDDALRQQKAAAGRQRAQTAFSVEAAAKRYATRLDAIEARLSGARARL